MSLLVDSWFSLYILLAHTARQSLLDILDTEQDCTSLSLLCLCVWRCWNCSLGCWLCSSCLASSFVTSGAVGRYTAAAASLFSCRSMIQLSQLHTHPPIKNRYPARLNFLPTEVSSVQKESSNVSDESADTQKDKKKKMFWECWRV